jgi:hypothetical protein
MITMIACLVVCCMAPLPGEWPTGTDLSVGMRLPAYGVCHALPTTCIIQTKIKSKRLHFMRFLILPWVRVPHLASHLLAATRQRLSMDWQEKYGHPILLLETFVEQGRFAGTCYLADNWIHVGQTRGRSRNHNSGDPTVPVKSVWLYPLCRGFRQALTAPTMDMD